ncbi:molybdopterin-guanine dinucleotide biosynthesis protein B [Orbus sturtevantii]|uniref:molybdopterin-guanine dinucleotide biosynthesis protein B n=1 Tax=Orbus sturtevantii TaxID=3074109 RepID=UPI00370D53BA
MKLIGICGYSGSGKTTLLKKLITVLKTDNVSLAVIKHSHHDMDIDIPGKDSYELRKSGVDKIIVACDNRWAFINETPNNNAKLTDLANQFKHVDLVLVEGFKDEAITKIICHRKENNKPLFYDKHTIAFAADYALETNIKQFDINNAQDIANFIKGNLVVK